MIVVQETVMKETRGYFVLQDKKDQDKMQYIFMQNG